MSEIEIAAPIRRMIDATNAEDREGFLDAFADDAYLEDWGRGFHGREGLARWDESDNIGKRSRFVALGQRADGDDLIVTVQVSGDGYNGTSDIRFTLTPDATRIARLLITP